MRVFKVFVKDKRCKLGYRVQIGRSCDSFSDDWVCKTLSHYVSSSYDGILYPLPGVRILFGVKEVLCFNENFAPLFYSETNLC